MGNEKNYDSRQRKNKITNSRVGLVDKESGELIDDGNLIYIPKKIRIEGFFMGMQDGFEKLAKEKLKSEELNVFLLLISRMDYENVIRITPKEIGETLDMKRQNVCRAMRKLKQAHVIDAGEFHSFQLCTEIGWKGKVRNLRNEQAKQTKLSMSRNSPSETHIDAMNVADSKLSKFKDSLKDCVLGDEVVSPI